MWIDDASDIDLLFYGPLAESIVNICKDSSATPLSIGLFGSWGAGKSTILKMINTKLDFCRNDYFCIHINAWELEDYLDAKTAVIETILETVEENMTIFGDIKEIFEKLKKNFSLVKLFNWVLPKVPTMVEAYNANPNAIGQIVSSAMGSTAEAISNAKVEIQEERRTITTSTIRNIKKYFSEMIDKSKIKNLVVIIDDLDRCLPKRIVEVMEAVKLFLMVKKTTFIFAMDESIVRYAIKQQYPISDSGEDVSIEYIEKLIQYPITVPKLSPKDIKNYFLLLALQKKLNEENFCEVVEKLKEDKKFLMSKEIAINEITNYCKKIDDITFLDEIDIIRNCISDNMKGNPRKAKRFLNSFYFKKELSKIYFPNCDFKILAKLMALYNLKPSAFNNLSEIATEYNIKNEKLEKLEAGIFDILSDSESVIWKEKKLENWLSSNPKLSKIDLSQYFYLTRDLLQEINDYSNYDVRITTLINETNFANTSETITKKIDKLIKENINIVELIDVYILKFTEDFTAISILDYIISKTIETNQINKICNILRNNSEKIGIKNIIPLAKCCINNSDIKSLIEELINDNKITRKIGDKILNGNI